MNRRFFLKSLFAAGVAASVDTDRMLWIPGERTVFIPRFTESQRAQWLMFLHNRDGWLRWFAEDPIKKSDGHFTTWPVEFEAEIRRKIAIGNARAKELGLDERLHRPGFYKPTLHSMIQFPDNAANWNVGTAEPLITR